MSEKTPRFTPPRMVAPDEIPKSEWGLEVEDATDHAGAYVRDVTDKADIAVQVAKADDYVKKTTGITTQLALTGETREQLRAFEIWFDSGQNYARTSVLLNKGTNTVRTWGSRFGWKERAALRIRAAYLRVDDSKIDRAAEVMKKHRDAAALLLTSGLNHITENGLDNSKDAINAVKLAIEIERHDLQLPDYIVQVQKSNNKELADRAQRIIDELRELRAANAAGTDGSPGEGTPDDSGGTLREGDGPGVIDAEFRVGDSGGSDTPGGAISPVLRQTG